MPIIISRRLAAVALAAIAILGCPGDTTGPIVLAVSIIGGDGQTGVAGTALANPFVVLVEDTSGNPAPAADVHWTVFTGTGTLSAATSLSDSAGHATAGFTLGTTAGPQMVRATVAGAAGSPLTFTATATAGPAAKLIKYAGDQQSGPLSQPLATLLTARVLDQYDNPVAGDTVRWAVTAGGGTLADTVTVSNNAGLASTSYTLGAATGVNTVTASHAASAPITFSATAVAGLIFVTSVPIPANYGIHDTFVRDGLAFVFAWNSGVRIYDVGNGVKGGSPAAPESVSTFITAGGEVHNGWWFWNPSNNEKRYLFIGQEGPGTIGSSSQGDIHVLDLSNLQAPDTVARFHIAGGGPHNFWIDEAAQILYASYYNKGVVALDISGTLSGDLSSRGIDTIVPGGAGNTYVWSVMQHGASLYAIDMLSGLWQLNATGGHLSVASGGNNVPERYSSDEWVSGDYVYTGTWGFRSAAGNAVKIWHLGATGVPALVDSIITSNIGTVSDIEVTTDGKLLMFSAENGPNSGFYFYGLADPAHPAFLERYLVSTGVHTATFGYINGHTYAFGAKDPSNPALVILDVTGLIP